MHSVGGIKIKRRAFENVLQRVEDSGKEAYCIISVQICDRYGVVTLLHIFAYNFHLSLYVVAKPTSIIIKSLFREDHSKY